MELLIQGLAKFSDLVPSNLLILRWIWLLLLVSAVGSNRHVELSNLVSILAGCRYFDWSGPIEVEVAECVCQLLDVELGQRRVVLGHKEVCRKDAPLVSRSWSHVEVELLAVTRAIVLN